MSSISSILNQVTVKRGDITGKELPVTVVQTQTSFVAKSPFVAEFGRSFISAEEAVQRLLLTINENHPKQFEQMEPKKQRQLLTWVKIHLRKGQRGNSKRWDTYHLKDMVGQTLGSSVNNGELKGALLVAGLAPTKDTEEYDTYWSFVLERNPHLWSLLWRQVCYKLTPADQSR